MRPPLVAFVALVVLALGAGSARAANQSVTATSSNTFSPANVTVTQGETVTWTNGGGSHNVVFSNGPAFAQPGLSASSGWAPFSRTFNLDPGAYSYQCALHGTGRMFDTGMDGTVTVEPAPTNPPPTSPPPPGPTDPGAPTPPPGGPDELDSFKVKLNAADRTPLLGKRFVLSGTVAPARDGRKLQIQRRLANGRWKTIASVTLKDAGSAKSKFSLRLKLSADAVLRARLAGDDQRSTGLSKRLAIDVHR